MNKAVLVLTVDPGQDGAYPAGLRKGCRERFRPQPQGDFQVLYGVG